MPFAVWHWPWLCKSCGGALVQSKAVPSPLCSSPSCTGSKNKGQIRPNVLGEAAQLWTVFSLDSDCSEWRVGGRKEAPFPSEAGQCLEDIACGAAGVASSTGHFSSFTCKSKRQTAYSVPGHLTIPTPSSRRWTEQANHFGEILWPRMHQLLRGNWN